MYWNIYIKNVSVDNASGWFEKLLRIEGEKRISQWSVFKKQIYSAVRWHHFYFSNIYFRKRFSDICFMFDTYSFKMKMYKNPKFTSIAFWFKRWFWVQMICKCNVIYFISIVCTSYIRWTHFYSLFFIHILLDYLSIAIQSIIHLILCSIPFIAFYMLV